MRLIASLHAGTGDTQVVNVRNGGALPGLSDDAVVEVPCHGRWRRRPPGGPAPAAARDARSRPARQGLRAPGGGGGHAPAVATTWCGPYWPTRWSASTPWPPTWPTPCWRPTASSTSLLPRLNFFRLGRRPGVNAADHRLAQRSERPDRLAQLASERAAVIRAPGSWGHLVRLRPAHRVRS